MRLAGRILFGRVHAYYSTDMERPSSSPSIQFSLFFFIFQWHLKVQATSTMNQSDIRGLVRHERTSADIDILRRERSFLQTRVQSITGRPIASRDRILLLSCLHLSVPAFFSVFNYQRTTSEDG